MRIAMIGGGYVGLVSGTCFAEFGTDVAIVETNPDRLTALREGRIPIYEPGLDRLVEENVEAGRLTFGDDIAAAVKGADAVFVAVGTPSRRGDGQADTSYVYAAVEQIARVADGYTVIVTKSTVPVGTGREIAQIIRKTRPDLDFDVASNPEFLREGNAIQDFMRPDRVIIGTDQYKPEGTERAQNILRKLYRPLYLLETPIVFTGLETAELIKYSANSFLAMKITFINEISDLCEKVGANVNDVARSIGLDGRIGKKFLHPSPGFGGSCFPKDTRALTAIGRNAGSPVRLIETTVAVNEQRMKDMGERVITFAGGDVSGLTIGVLGLTFKPETDDMREAASIPVLDMLDKGGAKIRAFDPAGMTTARPVLPQSVTYCTDALDAAKGADILVVLTEWNEFRSLAPEKLAAEMKGRKIADLRNIWDPKAIKDAGFEYISLGRPDGVQPHQA
ncbi:UDP-glucose/GDP-mannose dehydrogenase family protein [Komagataeibacter oboediens]|uniref:UDP-glucose 6-dehydrogenase n=2 Tax=Komagataeibacter TaxID=1434011 RepID=O31279_KOMXY|nr:UDP-glucose/GDP-mannose dehydrogenase family protein [Komagataeibacter oboediens]MBV0888189.1 UDP-glucose/GDP-mannose dehydrogenase family protein [Komagataeibacter oboediens]MBV1824433.1 UDP-glucose/GDP-mannose dehydrogenase family protein [Komagataeibacter oboediens]MCK9820708.1 UDP-glucose/GDP-mannose dehydrogenase family protein [Komagataeibacter oboediens]CAA72087.1 UDP-glucose dehydrogenase [Komagataeibacter xylinus]